MTTYPLSNPRSQGETARLKDDFLVPIPYDMAAKKIKLSAG
jgi:hypothetical protein